MEQHGDQVPCRGPLPPQSPSDGSSAYMAPEEGAANWWGMPGLELKNWGGLSLSSAWGASYRCSASAIRVAYQVYYWGSVLSISRYVIILELLIFTPPPLDLAVSGVNYTAYPPFITLYTCAYSSVSCRNMQSGKASEAVPPLSYYSRVFTKIIE